MIDLKANILIVWNLCMGMPNSLGNFARGCQIPCSVGDTKSTEGLSKSLGDLARGCQILGGVGSPMTPDS